MEDIYSALWMSYSKINTFLRCPRAYFLSNVYKDPMTGHKVSVISPALALGQVVHEVVEGLSVLPTKERFTTPLHQRFEKAWKKISGKAGGFAGDAQEASYKLKGEEMISRVVEYPGPLERLAVKIKQDLPRFWLSKEEGIILCGKIDWLEYLPDIDSVHIIDFKTGKKRELDDSLQLPIYYLLTERTQKRAVKKASYWYLQSDNTPEEVPLPDLVETEKRIMELSKKIQLAHKLEKFACPKEGCRECEPYELILEGKARLVGVNDFRQDVYYVPRGEEEAESEIL